MGTMSGQNYDAIVKSTNEEMITAGVLLGVLCLGCACLFIKGCPWHRAAAHKSKVDNLTPKSCCGIPVTVADHASTRAVHKGKRVHSAAFDCIRGFGALQVSLGHFFSSYVYYHEAGGIELGGGNAVIMFFLMSGFVMQVGYAGKGPADGACCGGMASGCGGAFAREFWARRVARIGPVYWLSVLLFLPIAIKQCIPMLTEIPDGGYDPVTYKPTTVSLPEWKVGLDVTLRIVLTLLFMQTWAGFAIINGPLWSVVSQFELYALFPALTDRMHRTRSGMRLAIEGIFWWQLYFWYYLFRANFPIGLQGFAHPSGTPVGDLWSHLLGGNLGDIMDALTGSTAGNLPGVEMGYLASHFSPLAKIPLFLLGMMFGSQALINSAYTKTPSSQRAWNAAADAVTVFLAGYTVVQGTAHIYWGANAGFATRVIGELTLPLAYSFWLFALSQAPESLSYRVFCWKPFRLLGDWSFAIYCLQWPVFTYFSWAFCASTQPGWDFNAGLAPPLDLNVTDPNAVADFYLQEACVLPAGELSLPQWAVIPVFAIIILISQIAFYGLETPARARLYKLLMGKRGTARAGGAASMIAEQQQPPPPPPQQINTAPEQGPTARLLPISAAGS